MTTRKSTLNLLLVTGVAALEFCLGCSKKPEQEPSPTVVSPAVTAAPAPTPTPPSARTDAGATASPEPSAPLPVPGPAAAAAGMSGTITVEPNPVKLCDKTGLGTATVSWTVKGTTSAEIRVNSPGGGLLSWKSGPTGKAKTGQWVGKGMTFYLQNGAADVPRTAEQTIARVTIETTGGGPCP